MDDKLRCQSCGMPVSAEFKNFGTEAGGTPGSEYCMFCYKDGDLTDPDQTIEGMVQSSVEFMTSNLGFSRDEATQMSNDVIPHLKRWH